MGVVYRAEHVGTLKAVALKTVRAASLGQLAGIRREIRALARIDHPGVIRILDEGVSDGLPWYAMELLEGHTLREHESTPTGDGPIHHRTVTGDTGKDRPTDRRPRFRTRLSSEELTVLLTLFRRICSALAFVHGEGLAHCDLKPENVFLAGGSRPVLVDFGLISRFGGHLSRDVLDVEPFMGTAEYMAPEQWERRPIDGRADLYALGCIMFEMLTGAPPWVGTRVELSKRHLLRDPPLPSSRTAGIPREIDELLLRLLAKRPRDRIGHAEEVGRVLGGLGAAPPDDGTEARPYLFRPALAGRDETVATIVEILASEKECAPVVLLSGESGAGKTRVAIETARMAKRGGLRVVTGECTPLAEPHPLQNLLHLIADRARTGASADLLRNHVALLAHLEPTLRALVAERTAEARSVDPDAQRERVLEALLQSLEILVEGGHLTYLVLDDLQWADALTLGLVARIPDRGPSLASLSVLATYRSEEITPALEALIQAPVVETVALDRLSESAVERMVSDMLGYEAPGALASFVTHQSEGNPFFVGEYLRAALGEGVLMRTEIGGWQLEGEIDSLGLPRTLRDLVGHRIDRLGEGAKKLLYAMAVVGRESAVELSAAVAGLAAEQIPDAIEELLFRQIVEETASSTVRLSHDKLREVAYERLSPAQRRSLHEVAADALQASGAAPAVLAHHYEQGGRPLEAIENLEAAARTALSSGSHERASGFLERALELSDGLDFGNVRRSRWYRMLAQSRLAGGDLAGAAHAAHSALDVLRLQRPTTRAEWTVTLIGQLARQIFHRLVPSSWIVEHGRDELLIEATLASGTLSRVAFFENDPLQIVANAFWAVNLAERAGRFVQAARNYSGLGWIFGLARLHSVADAYFARARETAAETADHSGLVFALTSEAIYRIGRCQWERAQEALTLARTACEETNDKSDLELVETLFGHPAYFLGDVTEAVARHEAVLASAERRGHKQHQAWSYYCIARCLIFTGETEKAADLLEKAANLLADQTDELSEIATYGLLATAATRLGDTDRSLRAAGRVEELLAKAPPTVFLSLHGYEGVIEARLAARDAPGARASLRRLQRFASAFPVGRAAAAFWTGRLSEWAGRKRAAERAYARAAESGLPCWAGPAFEALARLAPEGSVSRSRHLDSARNVGGSNGTVG